MIEAFTAWGPTVNIAAGAATLRVAFNPPTVKAGSARIYNSGAETVFIAFGDVTVVATTAAGIPIGPGVTEVLGCGGQSNVAAIAAAGPATIYFTPGEGL